MEIIKTFYINTTDYEIKRCLKENKYFETSYLYDTENHSQSHQNEYGELRLDNLRLKILLGNIKRKNCHWCGGELVQKSYKPKWEDDPFNIAMYCKFYLKCSNCSSRGPVLNVNERVVDDMHEWVSEYLKQRYSEILPWDHELKNKSK